MLYIRFGTTDKTVDNVPLSSVTLLKESGLMMNSCAGW